MRGYGGYYLTWDVVCPKCDAPVNEKCRNKLGTVRFHKARVDLAREKSSK